MCWPLGRGTGGAFGDVGTRLARHAHVVVFEAKGVGDPRIFGAGLGGEATSLGKGETDDGGEVRRRC